MQPEQNLRFTLYKQPLTCFLRSVVPLRIAEHVSLQVTHHGANQKLREKVRFCGVFGQGNAVSFFPERCMSTKKSDIACFVEVPARQLQDYLRCVFLASVEALTVEFEKQASHHKSRALVAIYERMVAHHAPRMRGGHVDNVGRFGIGEVLLRPSQG